MSKITVTTIAGQTSGADANKVKIDPSNTLHVPGHAAIGADIVAGTRALSIAGATDGGSSEILNCFNSSLASKFSVRDDGLTTVAGTLTSSGLITASAGVAIGGTGAANTLDDYEEGTWTPIWRVTGGANSFNYTIQTGRYTKIGNRVFGLGRVSSNSHSGSGGGVSIQGFPFTATNITTAYHHFTFGHFTGFSYTGTPYGYVNSNTIYADLQANNNGSINTPVYPSSSSIDIIFQFMYETDA